MARDEAELQLDDILPVAWTLGEWQGAHPAYPLAGYANVLNYRKDLLEQAGIAPPATQEELLAAAQALTDADAGAVWNCAAGRQGLGSGAGLHGVGAAARRPHPRRRGQPCAQYSGECGNLEVFWRTV
jgi:ABC-type glycerol-3-phosphate transport system substrate-binding protein